MSDELGQGPIDPTEGQKPDPEVPAVDISGAINKGREALDEASERAAVTVNQNFGTELSSQDVHPALVAGKVLSVATTAFVIYWAAKKGTTAAMADFTRTGQTLADAAGRYADVAQANAEASMENVIMIEGMLANFADSLAKAGVTLKIKK